MRDTNGVERSCPMQSDVLRGYLVKQTCSIPEKYWNEVEVQFIEESALHELLDDVGPAEDRDVFVTRDSSGLCQRIIDSVSYQEVRRASTLDQAIARAVRNDEYRHMERRMRREPLDKRRELLREERPSLPTKQVPGRQHPEPTSGERAEDRQQCVERSGPDRTFLE